MTATYFRRGNVYGGFGRSNNACEAEANDRLPRTRAAKRLRLSLAAFDAGCAEADYQPTEWHHVGKFASEVCYYDAEELAADPTFWRGAATVYKAVAKRRELFARAEAVAAEAKAERIDAFRVKLARNRNCEKLVCRHDGLQSWREHVTHLARIALVSLDTLTCFAKGDLIGVREAIAIRIAAREEARKALFNAGFASSPGENDLLIWTKPGMRVVENRGGFNVQQLSRSGKNWNRGETHTAAALIAKVTR